MGAVPKRKISKSRRNRRRSHHRLDTPVLVVCEECGEMKRPHYMCPVCGTYKGIQVIQPRTE
ncbi:MAG: 50S ribosomal protein L32 [Chloroflexota bacterium]